MAELTEEEKALIKSLGREEEILWDMTSEGDDKDIGTLLKELREAEDTLNNAEGEEAVKTATSDCEKAAGKLASTLEKAKVALHNFGLGLKELENVVAEALDDYKITNTES